MVYHVFVLIIPEVKSAQMSILHARLQHNDPVLNSRLVNVCMRVTAHDNIDTQRRIKVPRQLQTVSGFSALAFAT